MTLGGRQHVVLDRACEERVGRLVGGEALVAATVCDPVRLDELAAGCDNDAIARVRHYLGATLVWRGEPAAGPASPARPVAKVATVTASRPSLPILIPRCAMSAVPPVPAGPRVSPLGAAAGVVCGAPR